MKDVLIVGASVAGAATAIHLASHGLDVMVIDRDDFPRRKPCGEGLFPAGVAELHALGASSILEGSTRIESVRFSMGDVSVEAAVGSAARPAYGVQREVLDAALVERARTFGVAVCTGVTARALVRRNKRYAVETDAGVLEARVIVAADGIGSRLRRAAGLDVSAAAKRFGVSAHVRLPDTPSPRVDVYFEDGYEVYVTPVGGHVVNVALLMQQRQMATLAGRLHEGYLARVSMSGALSNGLELLDEPRAAGPFPVVARRLWRDNLVLVGDAAGFFDGVSGEGMSIALVSARHAAAAIDAYLTTGDGQAFRAYARRRQALERNSTLLARLTLALAVRPSLGRRAIMNLSRRPETFAKLVAINSGEAGLRSLRPRDLLALALGK